MKKGFTLIELLAVIVILAIVALIITPLVSHIIENSKLGALRSSADGLVESAKLYVMEYKSDETIRFDIIDGEMITMENQKLEYSGMVVNGIVLVDSKLRVSICLTDGVNSAYKAMDDDKVSVYSNQVCNISYEESENHEESTINYEEPTITLTDKETKTSSIYASVAELKSSTKVKNGDVVGTKGFYKASDGGGAYYEITNESLTADDISIFQLDNGLYAKLIIKNQMNLKQFGAHGDGSTSDSLYINEAFKKVKGHILYVPSGTYIITDRINTSSNIIVIGEGKTSLFKAVAGMPVSSDMFQTRDKSNLTFKKVAFSGNIQYNTKEAGHSATDGIHMFDVWNSSNINIEDCYFMDNVYAAIRIIGGTHIHVKNSKFLTVDCGVITLGSSDNSDLVVENNLFDGHANSEPISIYGTGKTTDVVIKNNTIKNKTYATAIFVGRGTIENIKVIGNNISGVSTGIVASGTNVVIKNNAIDNSSLTSGGYGIQIGNSSLVTVSNNTLNGIWLDGMRISESTNVDIYNNTIKDSGRSNNDFTFVRFAGSGNVDVKFHDNNVIRQDTNLGKNVMLCFGKQKTQIINNNIVNGEIYLWTDSSSYIVKNNHVAITNRGTNNIIEN